MDGADGTDGTEGADSAEGAGGAEGMGEAIEIGGIGGAGSEGPAGMNRGPLKLKPQASQNWPVLGVSQRGQVSAAGAGHGGAALGAGTGPVAGPLGVPPMRIPQTSQKSSLAESCPFGHTAIAPPPHSLFLHPDRLGRPGVEGHLVGVLDFFLQPDRAGFQIDHVYHLGQQLGGVLVA